MGQYYKPTILNKKNTGIKAWWYSWDYDNGLKLMEHSYMGNSLCNAVEHYLMRNPQRLVWAGDYADNEKGMDTNIFMLSDDKEKRKITDGDTSAIPSGYFVVNHTHREYYRRDAIEPFEKDWIINPLPILTCEGNGRGGGDYHCRTDADFVGTWARCTIEVTDKEPGAEYAEIQPYFSE